MSEPELVVKELPEGVEAEVAAAGWERRPWQPDDSDGRTLFVEFSDYVLVVEAPFGAGATEAALKEIEKTVPGKPVRYVAFTHPHTDHAAGAVNGVRRIDCVLEEALDRVQDSVDRIQRTADVS